MKEKQGITLIALVITIIVMLILVAVTISMAINGGLFKYAGKATRDTELAKQEELELAEGSFEVDGKLYNSPQEYIDGIETTPKYSPSLLDANGVLRKNAIYTDENNETVEIPKGFKVSGDSSENTKTGGLVIQDKDGNEFVWIPVEYEGSTKNDDGFYPEFLAVFYRSEWSNNERSTDLTESTQYLESQDTDPTGKYTEMMLSVQEHKGFYIGRYETGTETERTYDINGDYGTNTIVVKRDCYPYNYVAWGVWNINNNNAFDINGEGICIDYSTGYPPTQRNAGKCAVYLSRNMYSGDEYGVTSTLCYSIQWDAILDFVKDTDHNVNTSTLWGNYKGNTGTTWEITRQTAKYSTDHGKTWTSAPISKRSRRSYSINNRSKR